MPTGRPRGRPPKAKHLDTLLSNLTEVARLIEIHTAIAGPTVGAKHKVEVLNRSGIILLVACWEAFVEDLAEVSFRLLLRRAKQPDAFPTKVLTLASKNLRDDRDERRVWDLAGDGWRSVLKAYQEQVLKRYIGSFNTPKPDKIDELFASLIAIPQVSSKWSWPKTAPRKARARLTRLVTLRGAIAHRVSAPRSVLKRDLVSATAFVRRLAVATHNAVNASLRTRLGHTPWEEYEHAG